MHISILRAVDVAVVDVDLEAMQFHDREHGIVESAAGRIRAGKGYTYAVIIINKWW